MKNNVAMAERYIKKAEFAKKAGHEFELSFKEYKRLMKQKRCEFSNLKFSEYENGLPVNKWTTRTLDRIDNNLGYIDGNVAAICSGINQLKSIWEDPSNQLTADMVCNVIKNIKKR